MRSLAKYVLGSIRIGTVLGCCGRLGCSLPSPPRPNFLRKNLEPALRPRWIIPRLLPPPWRSISSPSVTSAFCLVSPIRSRTVSEEAPTSRGWVRSPSRLSLGLRAPLRAPLRALLAGGCGFTRLELLRATAAPVSLDALFCRDCRSETSSTQ